MSPPSLAMALLEARAAYETGAAVAFGGAFARCLPAGSRRVLVLPGFLAGDASTRPMRKVLGQLGHEVHAWGLGRNLGPTASVVEGLAERVESLTEDGVPLDLVGWSLGGIFAREVAREAPERIGVVVTLGSPIQARGAGDSHARIPFSILEPVHVKEARNRVPSAERSPMPVPATSIYSRTDGIVPWQDCLAVESATVENVEVFASHCGMGANLATSYVIADRLAAAGKEWRPFEAPMPLRALFPAAPSYRLKASA